MWRPEQTNFVSLKHINTNFTIPGELVVKLCTGNFSTASVFILLPKDLFLGRYDNSSVVEAAKPFVVLTYATQLLNNGSDITASDDVLSAASVHKDSMKRLNARKVVDT